MIYLQLQSHSLTLVLLKPVSLNANDIKVTDDEAKLLRERKNNTDSLSKFFFVTSIVRGFYSSQFRDEIPAHIIQLKKSNNTISSTLLLLLLFFINTFTHFCVLLLQI
ncbi:unnamed protein product [Rhizopus stolonifer]